MLANVALPAASPSTSKPSQPIELVFRPDPSLGDGQHANNGWLQELPKPLTKIAWDNVALISGVTAARLGLSDDPSHQPGNRIDSPIVEIAVDGRSIKAPAWILPGQPDDVITIYLGHGRTHAGRVGNGVGFNAYELRRNTAPWFESDIKFATTSESMQLACTQNHSMMEQNYGGIERDLVRVAPIEKYESVAKSERAPGEKVSLSLYTEHDYSKDNKWGMVIDQNACIGCNACVVACQSENNIPVVGKEQVAKGREMQWLRIDAYFTGEAENPEGPYFQPVPCMHCENAPCEVVCPVEATVHDAEGTNNMVYNRCIGTRYCSNNCPYKVRHFNFLHYTKEVTGPLALMMNPNVTVRYRGVMEKCSFCIQRISAVRIDAKRDDKPIADGEVVTACQQSCPTMAITFGNLNDKNAGVTKLAAEPTNYGLLDELQTKPRTTYLPRFTNPKA
jgi:molybdopterin-containing oxidoreductase family iron-sulfur binding subunit